MTYQTPISIVLCSTILNEISPSFLVPIKNILKIVFENIYGYKFENVTLNKS